MIPQMVHQLEALEGVEPAVELGLKAGKIRGVLLEARPDLRESSLIQKALEFRIDCTGTFEQISGRGLQTFLNQGQPGSEHPVAFGVIDAEEALVPAQTTTYTGTGTERDPVRRAS